MKKLLSLTVVLLLVLSLTACGTKECTVTSKTMEDGVAILTEEVVIINVTDVTNDSNIWHIVTEDEEGIERESRIFKYRYIESSDGVTTIVSDVVCK